MMPGNVRGTILAGPAGVMAMPLEETGSDHYVVWDADGLSDPRDGVPVAFSSGRDPPGSRALSASVLCRPAVARTQRSAGPHLRWT